MIVLFLAWISFAADMPDVDLDIACRNTEATTSLRSALTDPNYWSDASPKTFEGKLWDEIRLKPVASGYVPMISGEGGRDFDHAVVADIVFLQQDKLPKYMEGAKKVTRLGAGHDANIGADYIDSFWVLDLTFFYAYYPQRMYRKKIGDRTVLWFEKLDERFVDGPTWLGYSARISADMHSLETRWAFNSILEVGELYGMFVVEPGKEHESRITFISRLEFREDAGWVAKMGSKMPSVLRSGLKSGFKASVELASAEQDRRP
jgi:hypothetical protein